MKAFSWHLHLKWVIAYWELWWKNKNKRRIIGVRLRNSKVWVTVMSKRRNLRNEEHWKVPRSVLKFGSEGARKIDLKENYWCPLQFQATCLLDTPVKSLEILLVPWSKSILQNNSFSGLSVLWVSYYFCT